LQSAGEENRIGYFGEQRDKESDYFAMGFRLYDPEIGRFLAIDPLLDVQPSQTPYHYCFNNPTSFTDPTGLYPEKEKGDKVQEVVSFFWVMEETLQLLLNSRLKDEEEWQMSRRYWRGLFHLISDRNYYKRMNGDEGGGGGGSSSGRTGTNESGNGLPTSTGNSGSNNTQTNNEQYGPPEPPQPYGPPEPPIIDVRVTNIIPETQEQFDWCLATVLHVLNNKYNKNPLSTQRDIYNMDPDPAPGSQDIENFINDNGYTINQAVFLTQEFFPVIQDFINRDIPFLTFQTFNPPIDGMDSHAVLIFGYQQNNILNQTSFIYFDPGRGQIRTTSNFSNYIRFGFILTP